MNLTEIKESLEPENIKQILSEYGVVPVREETNCFVFPTVCHNLDGGSPKMYYYFDSKLFVCYTECGESFNIFELIQKIEKLHGYKITIFEAAEKIGFGTTQERRKTEEEIEMAKHARFIENTLSRTIAPPVEYKTINKTLLNNLSYNIDYLKPWLDEGMTPEILMQFGIGYSVKDVAIAIPHKDIEGNIIGIRGRFMSEDAPNKYMPLSLEGKLLGHALRGNLYGLYENKQNIQRLKKVVIYEGEKSVLLHGSLFGKENNIAIATCGNKITNEQINLLIGLEVYEIVLAFDQDFKTPYERDLLMARYVELAERLVDYFTVSVIIDWDQILNYKDSPIDQGAKVFNEVYANRFYVGGN